MVTRAGSAAPFEREIIRERTSDKIGDAPQRQVGRRNTGARLRCGSGRRRPRLNEKEARRVREIFERFIQHPSFQRQSRNWRDGGGRQSPSGRKKERTRRPSLRPGVVT